MRVLALGVDVVDIDRLTQSIQRGDRFLKRVYSQSERQYCDSCLDPAKHYAARFAAKEAFFKALGVSILSGICLREVEVVREHFGAPKLRLGPQAQRALNARGCTTTLLSLAHSGRTAIAFVILQ